ncbi:IS1595 family transposase [Mucilaginibacter flavidus]|uniref:IS1595 family transposase n=1 Tax=Mucilaginibacter flavidus TaxID=2949309 RepID=UPI0020921A28|nr:IS1595 family transposase [Mucilaginibacter flavidus]MCO5945342.1 IS1595 family transposase [Mucilaginibacter flavidus]
MTSQFNSLLQVLDYFKDEAVCTTYLAAGRWGNTPSCPHCGNVGAYVTNRGYKCKAKECHKKFTVTTGTIFENTKISLRIWFAAIYLATAHKKGISSLQLCRDLNITQKTAWFLLHRIRLMLANNAPEMLEGNVEVDETFVGGKNKNRHANKKIEGSQGRSAADKTPVLGIAQQNVVEYKVRDHKVIKGRKVVERIVLKHSQVSCEVVANTEAATLHPIMLSQVKADSKVVTDAYASYKGLNKTYEHVAIKHTEGDYRTVGDNHTNTIEGFWSLLKRGIIGIYHNVSPKHLHRYCNEFTYRYNTRVVTDTVRFEDTFERINKRLTYKKLIA